MIERHCVGRDHLEVHVGLDQSLQVFASLWCAFHVSFLASISGLTYCIGFNAMEASRNALCAYALDLACPAPRAC